jgi:hypothetical protein
LKAAPGGVDAPFLPFFKRAAAFCGLAERACANCAAFGAGPVGVMDMPPKAAETSI